MMSLRHTEQREFRWRNESGLSLAELLVVVTVLGFVLALSYLVFLSATNMSNSTQASSQAREAGMRALDRIQLELRQGRELTTGNGVFEANENTRCVFFVDLTPDTTNTLDKVSYYIDGAKLMRKVAPGTLSAGVYSFGAYGTPQLIIDGVSATNRIFTYYPQNSNEATSNTPAISWVKVEIVDNATVGNKTASVDLSTTVKIRSVHNELE